MGIKDVSMKADMTDAEEVNKKRLILLQTRSKDFEQFINGHFDVDAASEKKPSRQNMKVICSN